MWVLELLKIAGTLLAAGVGGWLGIRFDRKKFVQQRAHSNAEDAIGALRFLQRHRREVAEWPGNLVPEGELSPTHAAYDRLGRAITYLPDSELRKQLEQLYEVIGENWLVTSYGDDEELNNPNTVVWMACDEGLRLLGRYVRGEKTRKASETLARLRAAAISAETELMRQYPNSAVSDDH